MKDKEFLIWLYERLVCIHGESPNVDYMLKLKSIINRTEKDRLTPNSCTKTMEKIYEETFNRSRSDDVNWML